MRSILAGLRSLVIPWGAPPGTSRVEIGKPIPAALADYLANVENVDSVASYIAYYDDDTYYFDVLGYDAVTPRILHLRGTANGTTAADVIVSESVYLEPSGAIQAGRLILGGPEVDIIADSGNVILSGSAVGSRVEIREPILWRPGSTGNGSTAQYAEDSTSYTDFNSATFTPTANAPEITFVMPPSGKGTIRMFVRSDADVNNEQYRADVIIKDNNSGGTTRHNPSATSGGIEKFYGAALASSEDYYGERPLEPIANLTPGNTYWAQLQINTVGTNMDIAFQWIRFNPDI